MRGGMGEPRRPGALGDPVALRPVHLRVPVGEADARRQPGADDRADAGERVGDRADLVRGQRAERRGRGANSLGRLRLAHAQNPRAPRAQPGGEAADVAVREKRTAVSKARACQRSTSSMARAMSAALRAPPARRTRNARAGSHRGMRATPPWTRRRIGSPIPAAAARIAAAWAGATVSPPTRMAIRSVRVAPPAPCGCGRAMAVRGRPRGGPLCAPGLAARRGPARIAP